MSGEARCRRRRSVVKLGRDSSFQMYYGPSYNSGELEQYLADCGFTHTRGKPYYPMT